MTYKDFVQRYGKRNQQTSNLQIKSVIGCKMNMNSLLTPADMIEDTIVMITENIVHYISCVLLFLWFCCVI